MWSIRLQKEINSDHATFVNYIVAATVSVINAWLNGSLRGITLISDGNFQTMFQEVNVANTVLYCMSIGVVMGVLYLTNFFVMKMSIECNGAGVTAFFNKAGFFVTILLSALIWGDIPNRMQWVGIVLALMALVLFVGNFKEVDVIKPFLLFFQAVAGIVIEMNSKVFAMHCVAEYKTLLLAVIYCIALIGCSIYIHRKHTKKGEKIRLLFPEIICGVVIGLANVTGTTMQLKCLELLGAQIVFPTIAASNLLLTVLIGTLLFKEKSNLKQWIATCFAVVSLVFINI